MTSPCRQIICWYAEFFSKNFFMNQDIIRLIEFNRFEFSNVKNKYCATHLL